MITLKPTVRIALILIFCQGCVAGKSPYMHYWCCTDHKAPVGPHSGTDSEELKKDYGCTKFERC